MGMGDHTAVSSRNCKNISSPVKAAGCPQQSLVRSVLNLKSQGVNYYHAVNVTLCEQKQTREPRSQLLAQRGTAPRHRDAVGTR